MKVRVLVLIFFLCFGCSEKKEEKKTKPLPPQSEKLAEVLEEEFGEEEGEEASPVDRELASYRKVVQKFFQGWERNRTKGILPYLTYEARRIFSARELPKLVSYYLGEAKKEPLPRVGVTFTVENSRQEEKRYTLEFLLRQEGGKWKIYGVQKGDFQRSFENFPLQKEEELAKKVLKKLWNTAYLYWMRTGRTPTLEEIVRKKLIPYPFRQGVWRSYRYTLWGTSQGVQAYALPLFDIPPQKAFLISGLGQIHYTLDGTKPTIFSPLAEKE